MNKELFEKGLAARKTVLGEAYVNKSIANADAFAMQIQELVTEYCWGEIWTRPGLPFKTRSLLNIVMLTALNRAHELKIHVAGAIRNGCTKEEISEALLQATIYCGVPAGVEAFRIARDAFAENNM
jgi:4-carboxymuconolactone decarboxylase